MDHRKFLSWTDLRLIAAVGIGTSIWSSSLAAGRPVDAVVLCALATALYFFSLLPVSVQPENDRRDPGTWCLAFLCLAVGWATELLVFQTFAVVLLVNSWAHCRLATRDASEALRLWPILMLAFPWIDSDLPFLASWMRVSSAEVSSWILMAAGLDIVREGTQIVVNGQTVIVSEDCAGIVTIQAVLTVGLAAASMLFDPPRRLWSWLPLLCGLAWLTNVLRVVLICIGTLWFEPEVVKIVFHDWGGLVLIGLMLGLCIGMFHALNRFGSTSGTRKTTSSAADLQKIDTEPREASSNWAFWMSWILVPVCLWMMFSWRRTEIPDARQRLESIPIQTSLARGRDLPLSADEQRRLGGAFVLKREYVIANRIFRLTIIDGSQNRNAVHDPAYCWMVSDRRDIALPDGVASAVTRRDGAASRQAIYWFSDGSDRHASILKFWMNASLKNAGIGSNSNADVMVLLEAGDGEPVNWYRVLDLFPDVLKA